MQNNILRVSSFISQDQTLFGFTKDKKVFQWQINEDQHFEDQEIQVIKTNNNKVGLKLISQIQESGFDKFLAFRDNQCFAISNKRIAHINQFGEKTEVSYEASDDIETDESFVCIEIVSENLILVGSSQGNLLGFNSNLELLSIYKITEMIGS
jgi:hypothetical protein